MKEIEALAIWYRSLPGVLEEDGRVDIYALLNVLRVEIAVKTEKQMGNEKAYADFAQKQIACGREHAKGLRFGLPKVRYDFFHEIGHIAMHPSAELKALKRGGNEDLSFFIQDDESEERQAWRFARSIAVPRHMLSETDDSKLSLLVGIPDYAVALRREEVQRDLDAERPKKTPVEVHQFQLKSRLGDSGYAYVLAAWEKAAPVPGKDRRAIRLVGKFQIEFKHYGNAAAHTGWSVINGEVCPLMVR